MKKILYLSLCGVMLLAVAGCGETRSGEAYPTIYIQMAPIAPPTPKDEEIPASTTPRVEVWRPGYWTYNGSGFDWVSGELIARPSPTATWSPDRWDQRKYGWVFVPGYWQ